MTYFYVDSQPSSPILRIMDCRYNLIPTWRFKLNSPFFGQWDIVDCAQKERDIESCQEQYSQTLAELLDQAGSKMTTFLCMQTWEHQENKKWRDIRHRIESVCLIWMASPSFSIRSTAIRVLEAFNSSFRFFELFNSSFRFFFLPLVLLRYNN